MEIYHLRRNRGAPNVNKYYTTSNSRKIYVSNKRIPFAHSTLVAHCIGEGDWAAGRLGDRPERQFAWNLKQILQKSFFHAFPGFHFSLDFEETTPNLQGQRIPCPLSQIARSGQIVESATFYRPPIKSCVRYPHLGHETQVIQRARSYDHDARMVKNCPTKKQILRYNGQVFKYKLHGVVT